MCTLTGARGCLASAEAQKKHKGKPSRRQKWGGRLGKKPRFLTVEPFMSSPLYHLHKDPGMEVWQDPQAHSVM